MKNNVNVRKTNIVKSSHILEQRVDPLRIIFFKKACLSEKFRDKWFQDTEFKKSK